MPTAQAVLLPLCVGLSLLGLVVGVIAFVRGRRGLGLQGLAVAVGAVALYLTGLLTLVWDAVVALVRWATGNVFDLGAWVGLGLLVLAVVLWFVGGALARRSRRARKATRSTPDRTATGVSSTPQRTVGAGTTPARRPTTAATGAPSAPAEDDDMAEIEALLKSRGIQ